MQKPMISVRRRSLLAQTIRTENWLHDMAQKGFFLRQLSGNNYWFEQGEPGDVRYFLMSPEIGSNSDSWVFYEFERKMGKPIPYEGMSFTGPSLVLAVDGKAVDCQAPLAAYYYQYPISQLSSAQKASPQRCGLRGLFPPWPCIRSFRNTGLSSVSAWQCDFVCAFSAFVFPLPQGLHILRNTPTDAETFTPH